MNISIITGKLVNDIKRPTNKIAIGRLCVALSQEKRFYIDVVCFNGMGDQLENAYQNDKSVSIIGKLSGREYEDKEGNKRQSYSIIAEKFTERRELLLTAVAELEGIIDRIAQKQANKAQPSAGAGDDDVPF
jgi:single-stranded DNA-binding protein